MGKMYWFRVTLMVAFLAIVVWGIRKLNTVSDPHPLPVAVDQPANLCPTRITFVETPGNTLHLQQEGMKWIRLVGGKRTELDPIAVEKWFSQLCTLNVGLADDGPTPEYKPALQIGFISRKPWLLERAEGRDYEFRMKTARFKSPVLASMLDQLPTLPALVKPQ